MVQENSPDPRIVGSLLVDFFVDGTHFVRTKGAFNLDLIEDVCRRLLRDVEHQRLEELLRRTLKESFEQQQPKGPDLVVPNTVLRRQR